VSRDTDYLRRQHMKMTLCTALAAGLLALAGCGSSVERPTEAQVVKSLKDESSVFGGLVPPESADCFAKVLHKSDLSDGTLNAIVEGDASYKGSKSDEKVVSDLTEALVGECAPK
jgi:hypothetical protein